MTTPTIALPATRPTFDDADLDSPELAAPAAPRVVVIDTHADRINIPPETVEDAARLYPTDQGELILWFYRYARGNKWNLDLAARQLQSSTTTLSRVWRGQYREAPRIRPPGAPRTGKVHHLVPNPRAGELVPIDNLCAKIAAFKQVADARGADTRLPFVETSTYRKIKHLCNTALVSNDLAQLIGESQIGKTTAFKEIARQNRYILHVQTPPAANSTAFIREIGRVLGVCEGNQYRTLDRVKARLNDKYLLILDRLHFIFEGYTDFQILRVFQVIQSIFEDTGCAMILCGTSVFWRKVQRDKFTETFKQISRRGIRTLQLGTEPGPDDIDAILAHYGLALPAQKEPVTVRTKAAEYDVRGVVQSLAHDSGLGKMCRYLADAARVARDKEQPLTWEHFVAHYDINERAAKPVKGGR